MPQSPFIISLDDIDTPSPRPQSPRPMVISLDDIDPPTSKIGADAPTGPAPADDSPRPVSPARVGLAGLLAPGRRHEETVAGRLGGGRAAFGKTDSLADVARQSTGGLPRTDYFVEVTAPDPAKSRPTPAPTPRPTPPPPGAPGSEDYLGSILAKTERIERAEPRGIFDTLESMGRAPAAGVWRFSAGVWGAARAAAESIGLESLAEYARQTAGVAEALSQRTAGSRAGAGPTEQAVLGGLESVGSAAPSLTVGAVTGSPALSLALMGATTGGESYQRAREQGMSHERALLYGAVDGLVEAATERIPAHRLFRDLQGNARLSRVILNQLGAEIPGEQVATVLQDANAWANLPENREKPLSAFLEERPSAAAQTLIATIVGTLTQSAGAAGITRLAGAGTPPPPGAPGSETAPPAVEPVAPAPTATAEPRPMVVSLEEIEPVSPEAETGDTLETDHAGVTGEVTEVAEAPPADPVLGETDMFGNPIAVAEVESQGAPHNPERPTPGMVATMSTALIEADPARFQFKQNTDRSGVTNEARIEGPWNDNRAGILLVWRDPQDGKTYVVNGHHRLEAAKRLGAEKMAVRFIGATDSNEALVEGALTNIAEGRGTPVDVAKVVRDSGMDAEGLQRAGVDPKKALARDGLALAKLSDNVFHQVAIGEIPIPQAAAIGAANLSPEGQAAVVQLMKAQEAKGRTLTPGQVAELAQDVAGSAEVAVVDENQGSIFDVLGEEKTANTAVEKAVLRDWLKRELAKDRRLFGFVTKGQRAKDLAKAGNVIDVAQSKQVAEEAAQIEAIFSRLGNAAGPIATALNEAAVDLASGQKPDAVRPRLLSAVKAAVAAELRGARPSDQPRGARADRAGHPPDAAAGDPAAAPAGRAAGDVEPRKYSSTQVNLPPETAAGIRALAATIPAKDLAEDGREAEPHVTVQYGIESDDVGPLREALAGIGPITVTLGKTSLFENEDADVVKVDIDSPDLRRVRAAIRKAVDAPGDTHPTYIPHATVAYVKPGRGKAYAGRTDLEGQRVTLDRLVFSTRDHQTIEIPLTGEATLQGRPVASALADRRYSYAQAARIPTKTIDWGRAEKQGKRVKGMVTGAMADPPKGKKTYPDFEHAEGVTPAIWEELRGMDDLDKAVVIGALQAGLSEQEAFLLGYNEDPDQHKEPSDQQKEPSPTPGPATAAGLSGALNVSAEEGEALRELYDNVLMERTEDVSVVRGGEPGEDAIAQDDRREAARDLWQRIAATPMQTVQTEAWMTGPARVVKAMARDRAQAHGVTQLIERPDGRRIRITPKGVSSALEHGTGQQKVAVIASLPTLLREATLVSRQQREDGQITEVYAGRVRVGDEDFVARLIVRGTRGSQEGYFYDHHLHRLAPAHGLEPRSRGPKPRVLPLNDTGKELARRLIEDAIAVKGDPSAPLYQDGPGLFDEDVLDTGERQPRLPGEVGAVREEERPTPREELPEQEFRLTSEVAKPGRRKQPSLLALFQAAWHGSPHVFEKFSLHAIGTGEGNQAYGWGLYFAGDKSVAEWYRRNIGIGASLKAWVPSARARELFLRDYPSGYATIGKVHDITVESMAGFVKGGSKIGNDIAAAISDELLDELLEHSTRRGRLYRVEIPEDEDYLDWDRPLGEQSEKVQAAIRRVLGADNVKAIKWRSGEYSVARVGPDGVGRVVWDVRTPTAKAAMESWRRYLDEAPGEELYRDLVKREEAGGLGRDFSGPRAASERLAAEGVSGIRYLDGGSRNAQDQWVVTNYGEDGHVVNSFRFDTEAAAREFVGDGPRGFKRMYPTIAKIVARQDVAFHQPERNYNYVVFDDKLVQIMDFEQGAKGSVEFIKDDAKAIVRGFASSDVSTGVHELAHIARRWLLNRAVPPAQRVGVSDADIATTEQWAGVKDGQWTRAAEEKFARAFERYVRDKMAPPDAKIRPVLEKLGAWLSDIYQSLKGSPLAVKISPEMREVFDRLVTRRQRVEAEAAPQPTPPKAPRKQAKPTTRKAPSGEASTTPEGSDIPVKVGTVPRLGRTLFADLEESKLPAKQTDVTAIRPVEFPELVELAKTLMDTPKVVKAFRGDGRIGDFTPIGKGRIRLHAALFRRTEPLTREHPVGTPVIDKARNRFVVVGHDNEGDGRYILLEPEGGGEIVRVLDGSNYRADVSRRNLQQLAQTLAHEIGHLVDWLPDKTLKRGNLLGRLQSLHDFLQHTFSSQGGETIHVDDVRRELIEVSKAWRGDFNEKGSGSYDRYRQRGRELYADAISALLNNPGWLEQQAPTFYRAFFDHLDAKPEVRRAYFDLQELLSGTREQLVERRRAGVREMFEEGDAKAIEIERLRQRERLLSLKELWYRFRIQHVDKNTPLIDRVKALQARGVTVPDSEDPRYLLEERNYLGGKLKAFVETNLQPVYEALNAVGVDWHTFSERLFYDRIVSGDRSELANPRGLTVEAARELLEDVERGLTAEQREVLDRATDTWRTAVKRVADEAFQAGLYRPEMYAQIKENPAYAAYRVIDYLERDVTSKVHHQVGTLKDIQNVADATALKMLVTLRSIEYQKMKVATFTFLERHFPADIEQAAQQWNGKGIVPVPPKDPKKQVLVYYYEQGRLRGKYVDPYVADSLNNASVGSTWAVVTALRWVNSRVFRPVFTTYNPGFQTFNVARDFMRFWKNMPTMTFGRALARYRQASGMARVRAYGLPAAPTDKQKQAYADLIAAEHAKILSIPFSDLMAGRDPEETQIEDILAKSGIGAYQSKAERATVLKPFIAVLDWIKATGDFVETLPKAAGIYELTGDRAIQDLTPAERSFIRRKVGSPDFLSGGTFKPITNELLLFSNAITQAIRADVEVARDPQTASGFWWKTAAVNVAPKLALFAALYLVGEGDDDEPEEPFDLTEPSTWHPSVIRRALEGVSEYDLTNYLPLPLGVDADGRTVYVRMPQDDLGRLIGGLTWKLLQSLRGDREAMQSAAQVLDYTSGQFPGLTPSLTAVGDVAEFARGKNVYDDFRSRFLFTDDELAANDWRKVKKFLGYEFQQLGGSMIWRFVPGGTRPREQSTAQKILEFPLLVPNVVGRWIKISDFGKTEKLRETRQAVQRDEARLRLTEREMVNEALRRYQQLAPPQQTPRQQERLAREIVRELYPDARPSKRDRELQDVLKKIRMGVTRGQADATVDAVMGSTSNAQKVAVILRAKREMSPPVFQAWFRRAERAGVISTELAREVRRAERAAAR